MGKIYDKLVRDKIPEHIRSKGQSPKTHVAGPAEYWQKLKAKLREETDEFLASETIEEMADIQEVLGAICRHQRFSPKKIEAVRLAKAKERGSFKKKIILEEVRTIKKI